MKQNRRDSLRRQAIARKLNKLIRRPGFAPQDLRDAIESKLADRVPGEELNESEAEAIAFDLHPDLKAMEIAGTLPKELLDEDGGIWNPRMHIAMHTVVECQLAINQPAGILELAIQYEREGKLCAHEIKHVIAAALGKQIWSMQHENRPFDEKEYFADIASLYKRSSS